MDFRFPRAGIVALCLLGIATLTTSAAELRLRESLLKQQRDLVTVTVDARLGGVGPVHDLEYTEPISGDDCDVHMGLSSDDIRVPFVGEIQNACSMAAPHNEDWKVAIADQMDHGRGTFTGAFRIWLEHPPPGVQSEASHARASGPPSNPDHQVELHPLTQIGDLDLHDHVTWIEEDGHEAHGYGPTEFRKVLGWTIEVQRVKSGSAAYIRIKGPKFAYNHWVLKARALANPEKLNDGVRLNVAILDRNGHTLAEDIPLVAILDTPAGDELADLRSGDDFSFLGISTMSPGGLLSEAGQTAKEISVPVSFIVIGVHSD